MADDPGRRGRGCRERNALPATGTGHHILSPRAFGRVSLVVLGRTAPRSGTGPVGSPACPLPVGPLAGGQGNRPPRACTSSSPRTYFRGSETLGSLSKCPKSCYGSVGTSSQGPCSQSGLCCRHVHTSADRRERQWSGGRVDGAMAGPLRYGRF